MPDEMRQKTVNPARKRIVDRNYIALGTDPNFERMPVEIFIEARGCDEDGRG